MITQNQIKYYSSLLQKKYRQEEKKFIVEGDKLITEGIESGFVPEIIVTTQSFFEQQADYFGSLKEFRIEMIKAAEIRKLADTKTPQEVIAVFPFNVHLTRLPEIMNPQIVYLDNVSDPGNTGTILRNCDWFGVKTVLFSRDCVELYSPKVVRSSMGSIFHLDIYENVLIEQLEELKNNGYSMVCSDLQGEDVYNFRPPERYIAVFSNESHGPSENIRNLADHIISIKKKGEAESLNVASASAVILSFLTRLL